MINSDIEYKYNIILTIFFGLIFVFLLEYIIGNPTIATIYTK
jgi:hypothetical protein